MADFEHSIKHVLKWEGGYVWHPADPGGETNLGITDRLDGKVDGLIDVDGDGFGDVAVRHLTEEQARIIYRRKFWDRIKGDYIINQKIADILFDACVNCGVGTGVKIIQRVLTVKQDGILGPKTLAAINAANAYHLHEDFKFERELYYRDLVLRRPKSRVFLKGWLNRLRSFVYCLSILFILTSCSAHWFARQAIKNGAEVVRSTETKLVPVAIDPAPVKFPDIRVFTKDTLMLFKDSVKVELLVHHDTLKHLLVDYPIVRDTVEIPCDETIYIHAPPKKGIRWWHMLLAVILTAIVARIMK